jgi:hypothetical protein
MSDAKEESNNNDAIPSEYDNTRTYSFNEIMFLVENACQAATFKDLQNALQRIPNLGKSNMTDKIIATWKKFEYEPTPVDRKKPFRRKNNEYSHLGLLLAAIALGETNALAFRAHRALHYSDSRKGLVDKNNRYPETIATMMLMTAILGPSDNREKNDVEKTLPKIKKFYQQIPSHRYTTRPVPGNGNTLE